MKVSIQQLLGVNNVKYDTMVNIINTAYVNSNANTIHIYLDMYSIIKVLFSSINYDIDDYSSVTSSIINICSHYRYFFKMRYNVNSKFYIIFSQNDSYLNHKFIPEYNIKNKTMFNTNKKVMEMIENNIDLLKTIVPYIPDIYFIESQFETGVVAYDLMCRQDLYNKDGHMVVSKDVYNFQLVNMKDNCIVLRPKQSDQSYFINKNNLLQSYFMERKVKTSTEIISPDLFTILLSITSVQERNIPMLLNISKAVKVLEKAILGKQILNGYNHDIRTVFESLGMDIGFETFQFRFKAIDIQFQHSIYCSSPECVSMESLLVNKFDPEGIKQINNLYFKTNPLDLNRL